jgi:hypothetical protein
MKLKTYIIKEVKNQLEEQRIIKLKEGLFDKLSSIINNAITTGQLKRAVKDIASTDKEFADRLKKTAEELDKLGTYVIEKTGFSDDDVDEYLTKLGL